MKDKTISDWKSGLWKGAAILFVVGYCAAVLAAVMWMAKDIVAWYWN